LWAAVALGVIVRLAYALATHDHALAGDQLEYHQQGVFFTQGHWWWSRTPFGVPHPSLSKAPLYPFWVGALYSIGGIHPGWVKFAQVGFGAAVIILTWLLAGRLFGPRAATAAAFLVAIYPMAFQYEELLYSEAIATPLLLAVLVLAGCDEKNEPPAPSRFESVKKTARTGAQQFCEKSYPKGGEGSRKLALPATRSKPEAVAAGWTWLNVWATWCTPCVEEMGLLNRWREAASREGLPLTFELLSIDESDAEPKLAEWKTRNLPGPILWIRGQDDFGPFLDSLGIDRNAAIPIHVLVDPGGMVRCVRVGAIHEENWGPVKDLIQAG
jgi:thiol-disulfide isomerase/thioredoxin